MCFQFDAIMDEHLILIYFCMLCQFCAVFFWSVNSVLLLSGVKYWVKRTSYLSCMETQSPVMYIFVLCPYWALTLANTLIFVFHLFSPLSFPCPICWFCFFPFRFSILEAISFNTALLLYDLFPQKNLIPSFIWFEIWNSYSLNAWLLRSALLFRFLFNFLVQGRGIGKGLPGFDLSWWAGGRLLFRCAWPCFYSLNLFTMFYMTRSSWQLHLYICAQICCYLSCNQL